MTVTFADCLFAAASDPDLVFNYDRLLGANLSLRGSPLDLMVDLSSGRQEVELAGFVAFVKDFVWDRLPPDTKGLTP